MTNNLKLIEDCFNDTEMTIAREILDNLQSPTRTLKVSGELQFRSLNEVYVLAAVVKQYDVEPIQALDVEIYREPQDTLEFVTVPHGGIDEVRTQVIYEAETNTVSTYMSSQQLPYEVQEEYHYKSSDALRAYVGAALLRCTTAMYDKSHRIVEFKRNIKDLEHDGLEL